MMHASSGRAGVASTRRAAVIALSCASLVGVGSTTARPARADEGDAGAVPKMDNRARAQQLFDSALADAGAGNLASACPKFLASQEADPKTSTLLNLASCYEKNGQTASAWGAFREAEGLARKVARVDWETAARSHAEALEPKLVRLSVQVPEASRVPGLVIVRDGAKLGAGEWGVAIPVDPGEHVVSASATGRAPWETRSSVREASVTVAIPVLEALPTEAMPPPAAAGGPDALTDRAARSDTWWTPLRTAGVVIGGAGVIGVVTGGVLGLVAKSKYDNAHAQCTDGARGCPASAVSDSDSAYGLATGGTVVFVVGAAAALGGAALVLFSPPADAKTGSAPPAKSNGVSAALRFGPGAIALDGRW
jgi:hypothetical protein